MSCAALNLAEFAPAAATCVARVLFFGQISDVCGRSMEVQIPLQGCSLDDLKAGIAAQAPGAEQALDAPGVRVAIDQVMTPGEPWVSPGQEVAFLSVFSGG